MLDFSTLSDVEIEALDRIFIGSVGVLLSTGDYNRHVVGFFTRRGISF